MLSATIRARVEPELKADAGKILESYGLDLSTAIRIFLNNVVAAQGLPFELTPNAKTIAAMEEARTLSASFDSPEKLFEELEGKNAGEKGQQEGTQRRKVRSKAG